jgi:hypothetical protein
VCRDAASTEVTQAGSGEPVLLSSAAVVSEEVVSVLVLPVLEPMGPVELDASARTQVPATAGRATSGKRRPLSHASSG